MSQEAGQIQKTVTLLGHKLRNAEDIPRIVTILAEPSSMDYWTNYSAWWGDIYVLNWRPVLTIQPLIVLRLGIHLPLSKTVNKCVHSAIAARSGKYLTAEYMIFLSLVCKGLSFGLPQGSISSEYFSEAITKSRMVQGPGTRETSIRDTSPRRHYLYGNSTIPISTLRDQSPRRRGMTFRPEICLAGSYYCRKIHIVVYCVLQQTLKFT